MDLVEAASRKSWAKRSNVPPDLLATGLLTDLIGPEAALLSLRLGTAHLAGVADVSNPPTGPATLFPTGSHLQVTVRHDLMEHGRFDWSGQLLDLGSSGSGFGFDNSRQWKVSDFDLNIGKTRVHVVHASAQRSTDLFDPQPQFGGMCEGIEWGDQAVARHWRVWLVGVPKPHEQVTTTLAQVQVSLVTDRRAAEPNHGDSQPPPDLPYVTQVALDFGHDVGAAQVDELLERHLMWLLDIYSGRRVIPLAVLRIAPDGTAMGGHCRDYGRPLVRRSRRAVSSNDLQAFLNDVVPTWDAMTEDDRHVVRVATGVRHASSQIESEASVVLAATALELLAGEWLPPTKASYELTRRQKKDISDALTSAAQGIAPNSEFASKITQIAGNMFRRPAADQLGRLLGHLQVPMSEAEVGDFVKLRNDLIHGRLAQRSTQDKTEGMLRGQAMLMGCLLSRLGYRGSVYNEASHRNYRLP
ncbi:hypothetical protein [Longivirga aurantiaca]|uniref:ApeA N-terminal domain-containing protein n=1 Tax=Longivirga aurantiaca TaxID=1837743 RepID=A0ABW1T0H0_9ACTN